MGMQIPAVPDLPVEEMKVLSDHHLSFISQAKLQFVPMEKWTEEEKDHHARHMYWETLIKAKPAKA